MIDLEADLFPIREATLLTASMIGLRVDVGHLRIHSRLRETSRQYKLLPVGQFVDQKLGSWDVHTTSESIQSDPTVSQTSFDIHHTCLALPCLA